MRDLVHSHIEHVMCALLFIARLADVLSTYLATPSHRLESNPVAKALGWRFVVLSIFVCLIPYWNVGIGMVLLVVSLWVSGDNIARLWFIRSLGETEYHAMVQRAIERGSRGGRMAVCVGKAGCIAATGVILAFLTYTRRQPPLSFWFAVGILAYALLNLYTGLLHSHQMTRDSGTVWMKPSGNGGRASN
jgi:hypothetical protein